ncbi:glycerol kinase [Candidatus Marinamargulisbacteria bacterium SCGC AG-410-N11]|nr:glycerol kinase [Candidatus Marinamargulisbacteria bacterium SCGC AG-410-N11]
MSKKVIIALDLGTTGNRAIAFNLKGNIVASAYQEFKQYFPKEAWVEHNPMDIWTSTHQVLKQVIDQVSAQNVTSIGITNQRETTIIWNKKTGKPLHNAIVWQCRRTTEICNQLSDHAHIIKQKTGLFLDPYFSATKIKWLLDTLPISESDKKGLCFGTVDSWVLWQLTKGTSHLTDTSNASRTMLYNIHTLGYDSDLLKLFHIPEHILPQVKQSGDDFGTTDLFDHPIPITAIIGDQQASLFTQCGNKTTELKNTYGTGLFVVANTGTTPQITERLITTIAWSLNNKTYYALEGSIFVGGSAVQWCRDNLGIIKDSAESETLAQRVPDNDNVYFVPALTGLGAPYWDPNARGLLIGVTRSTQKEHICRAVLESLAYQTKDVIETIQQLPNAPTLTHLKVDGGATNNSFLMQFQADILGLSIQKSHITDITALGAAGIAGIQSSFWTQRQFEELSSVDKTFTPTLSQDQMNHLYKKWKQAVSKSLKWN